MNLEEIAIIIILYLLTLILPTCFWFLFFRYQDRKEPEPKTLVAYLFLWGILIAFISIIVKDIILNYGFSLKTDLAHRYFFESEEKTSNVLTQITIFLVTSAVVEEIIKLAAIYYLTFKNKYFSQIIDGVIYASAIALGFSFFENSIYFFDFYENLSQKDFFIASALRGVASVLLHVCATGIIGYYIGYAKYDLANKKKFILKGLILGIFIHIFFNLFIQLNYPINIIAFVLLFLTFLILFFSIQTKKSKEVWKKKVKA